MRNAYKYVIYTQSRILKTHVQSLNVTLIVLDVLPDGTSANIRIYLIFLETRITSLHFAADSIGLSSFIQFFGWLGKTLSFLQKCRFGRSRSSNVIDFWYQSKAPMRLPISPS